MNLVQMTYTILHELCAHIDYRKDRKCQEFFLEHYEGNVYHFDRPENDYKPPKDNPGLPRPIGVWEHNGEEELKFMEQINAYFLKN